MQYAAVDQKVGSAHLQRSAYIYIRQSTMHQVLEHTESTKRQYDLRQRTIGLGWPAQSTVIIDEDLGESGTYTGREGFARLVSDVGLGKAGIVCSLEVSRFARNNSGRHRLLEICALSNTLIMDEDGVYNPAHFNDRLLLGLKGTMSEVELHMIRARLTGGMMNKARRGELHIRLPVGFVYDVYNGAVVLDPDAEVQAVLRRFFEIFRRIGTLPGAVRSFNQERMQFPTRIHTGPHKGELVWRSLTVSRTGQLLHNSRYAAAYVYGRRQTQHHDLSAKGVVRSVERSKW